MRNEFSIRLEIYKTISLPNDVNRMLKSGPSVNGSVEESDGTVISYDQQKWTLTVRLATGPTIKIRQVQICPSPGEILKVKKMQTGEYEKI